MAGRRETLAKRFYVSGAVQGVGFRFFGGTSRGAARHRPDTHKIFSMDALKYTPSAVRPNSTH